MLNLKGFVLPPLLIWTVVIVGSILIAQDAVKKGYLGIEPISSPTSTPNPTSTPTSFSPKPTQKPVYVDPDPITDCNFKYIGTIKLKRSVCQKSTECQIGNKWVYYDSVDKCKKDQDATNKQITGTYTPPANTGSYTPPNNTSNLIDCPIDFYCNGYPTTYREDPTTCAAEQKKSQDTCQQQAAESQQLRQKLIDECKKDCVNNVVNVLTAPYLTDPNAPLSQTESESIQYRTEKLIHQCQASCH